MATVRKRKLPSGVTRWQAGYVDGAGKRRFKMSIARAMAKRG
jgi:integrase